MARRGIYQLVVIFSVLLFVWTDVAVAQVLSGASEVTSDFKYLANNVTDDAIDLATSPLHARQPWSSRSNLTTISQRSFTLRLAASIPARRRSLAALYDGLIRKF